jgi:hypothetical protein
MEPLERCFRDPSILMTGVVVLAAGLEWPLPCLSAAPRRAPWATRRLGPLLRTPERRLIIVEARRGLSSSPEAAPRLRLFHPQLPGLALRGLHVHLRLQLDALAVGGLQAAQLVAGPSTPPGGTAPPARVVSPDRLRPPQGRGAPPLPPPGRRPLASSSPPSWSRAWEAPRPSRSSPTPSRPRPSSSASSAAAPSRSPHAPRRRSKSARTGA